MLMMIILSFIGTLICFVFAYLVIYFTRTPLPFTSSLLDVVIPSIALNVAIGIPIYLLVKDWSKWLNPREDE